MLTYKAADIKISTVTINQAASPVAIARQVSIFGENNMTKVLRRRFYTRQYLLRFRANLASDIPGSDATEDTADIVQLTDNFINIIVDVEEARNIIAVTIRSR